MSYFKETKNTQLDLKQVYHLEKDSNEWHEFVKKYIYEIFHKSGEYTLDIISKAYNNDDLNKTINNLRKVQRDFGLDKELYSEAIAISKAKGLVNRLKYSKKIKEKKFNCVLDFGGGDGNIVHNVGKLLNLKKENVYVSDITSWSGIDWESKMNKNVIHVYPDKLNEVKRKFDLIIVSHVLHHIKDDKLQEYISTFYKLLNPKGIILLKEHNCYENEDKKKYLIDLEHMLYDTVLSQSMTYSVYMKTYYSKFRGKRDWEKLFSKFNSIDYYEIPHSKDFTYYQIFEKK